MGKPRKDETALATTNVSQYEIMRRSDIAEVVRQNLDGRQISPFDLDRVRFPAGGGIAWEVETLEGISATADLTGIIIHKQRGRVYYAERFAGGGEPPDCSSADGLTGVGTPGGACFACPMSQWGSALDDKGQPSRGQACAERQLLFLVRPKDPIPMVVNVPPTSLGRLNNYFLRLAGRAIPYWGIVTKLTLEKAKNRAGIEYSQLKLSAGDMLTENERAKIAEIATGFKAMFSGVSVADIGD